MKIVIDTNVLISGVFFGGFPRKVLNEVIRGNITACATAEIVNEYEEIIQEMIDRKQRNINRDISGAKHLCPASYAFSDYPCRFPHHQLRP